MYNIPAKIPSGEFRVSSVKIRDTDVRRLFIYMDCTYMYSVYTNRVTAEYFATLFTFVGGFVKGIILLQRILLLFSGI